MSYKIICKQDKQLTIIEFAVYVFWWAGVELNHCFWFFRPAHQPCMPPAHKNKAHHLQNVGLEPTTFRLTF